MIGCWTLVVVVSILFMRTLLRPDPRSYYPDENLDTYNDMHTFM